MHGFEIHESIRYVMYMKLFNIPLVLSNNFEGLNGILNLIETKNLKSIEANESKKTYEETNYFGRWRHEGG